MRTLSYRRMVAVLIGGVVLLGVVWLALTCAIPAIPYTAAHRHTATATAYRGQEIEKEIEKMRQRLTPQAYEEIIRYHGHTREIPRKQVIFGYDPHPPQITVITATPTPPPR